MPPAPSSNQHNAHSSSSSAPANGEAAAARTTRRRRSNSRSRRGAPKPWFVLKLSVGLSAAIIAYTSYVYIGRLCIPMIRREQNSLGSRTLGIVFLVVFAVLGMMMIWAYIKVVFTPPGYAVKHFSRQQMSETGGGDLASRENSTPYQAMPPAPLPQVQPPRPPAPALPRQLTRGSSTRTIPPSPSSLPSPSSSRPPWSGERPDVPSTLRSHSHSTNQSQPRLAQPSAEGSGHADTNTAAPAPISERQRSTNNSQSQSQTRSHKLPTRAITPQRKPHRYCETCGITKPPRTHHCRTCGTCVLRYDHHCPWIGQCVGAQNEKFFFVFVVWATFFCLWTLGTLVGLIIRAATRHETTVDPQKIATIALSGLFSMFTVVMLSTHFVLISTNQTTLEHFNARTTKDRENDVLDEMHSPWDFRAKRRTRRKWDAEYGRIGREGNMWWLGSMRANWEQIFGPKTWTWLLPIGTAADKGVDFPRNPRFSADGAWLPRKQWPPELR